MHQASPSPAPPSHKACDRLAAEPGTALERPLPSTAPIDDLTLSIHQVGKKQAIPQGDRRSTSTPEFTTRSIYSRVLSATRGDVGETKGGWRRNCSRRRRMPPACLPLPHPGPPYPARLVLRFLCRTANPPTDGPHRASYLQPHAAPQSKLSRAQAEGSMKGKCSWRGTAADRRPLACLAASWGRLTSRPSEVSIRRNKWSCREQT